MFEFHLSIWYISKALSPQVGINNPMIKLLHFLKTIICLKREEGTRY